MSSQAINRNRHLKIVPLSTASVESSGEVVIALSDGALIDQLRTLDGWHFDPIEYLCGYVPVSEFLSIPWGVFAPQQISVQMAGTSRPDRKRIIQHLKSENFRPAGGGSEVTGTDIAFESRGSAGPRTSPTVRHLKFKLGRAVVWIRDRIISREVNRIRLQRLRRQIGYQRNTPLLDPDFGAGVSQVSTAHAEAVALSARGLPSILVPLLFADSVKRIEDVAQTCFQRNGVWPISFSFPGIFQQIETNKSHVVSEVIPGWKYSFNAFDEYLTAYGNAYIAVSHRKAGWDCFRHVEILAAGSLPLMFDAKEIPEFTMVHYPKDLLQATLSVCESAIGIPTVENAEELQQFLNRNLSCVGMAEYILKCSGLSRAEKILFVDEKLESMPDYLSIFSLIGLKQLLGTKCEVTSQVDYLYQDWEGNDQSLYGRGFGYTRVLDPAVRTMPITQANDSFDVVVVGSISRNRQLAMYLLGQFPAAQTIWIHGEDTPPLLEETKFLLDSGTHVFVRAIH